MLFATTILVHSISLLWESKIKLQAQVSCYSEKENLTGEAVTVFNDTYTGSPEFYSELWQGIAVQC